MQNTASFDNLKNLQGADGAQSDARDGIESTRCVNPTTTTPASDHSQPIVSQLKGYPGFEQIVDDYIASLPGKIAELQTLVNQQDLQPLRRFVHQIKGSGGGYGFDLITDMAAKAENVIDCNGDRKQVVDRIDSLINVIRRVEGFDSKAVVSK